MYYFFVPLDLLQREGAKQNKCFCPQSRLKQSSLKRKTRAGKTPFPFALRAALRLERNIQRQKRADGALLALEKTTRSKRKAWEPGGRSRNAGERIIRKEIYCIYSHLSFH